jgi:dUTP pyrophosphatase
MEIKIKRIRQNAIIPNFAKNGDACVDLTAAHVEIQGTNLVYYTGIAIEIPANHVGLLFPRSSVSKKDIILANSVGVIDSGYRGEIMLKYKWIDPSHFGSKSYNVGERVGQLMILKLPSYEFVEVEQLSTTERGTGGLPSFRTICANKNIEV